jgi:hypothetical protein
MRAGLLLEEGVALDLDKSRILLLGAVECIKFNYFF